MTRLDGCYSDGENTVTVVTYEKYIKTASSKSINITIYDIYNFDPYLTSGLVSIQVTYSGVNLDISPSTETNRKFSTTEAPMSITLDSSDYTPRTQAEPAD